MLKIITTLTMFVIGLLAQSQVTENVKVLPFSKIEASKGVEIFFAYSEEYSMKAAANSTAELHSITMNCTNNTLSVSKTSMADVRIYVTAPQIKSIIAETGAKITIMDKITSDDVSISLATGASLNGTVVAENINLAAKSESVFNVNIKSARLRANFAGKAKVNLSGTADNAVIQTSQDAYCNARNFITKTVKLNAEDASLVTVYAGEKINVSVADMAKVKYFGTPKTVVYTPDAVAMRTITNRALLTQN